MAMSMRERIARAMMRSKAWPVVFKSGSAELLADAILSELETPTEGMVDAGWANALGEDAAGVWASMIRAAREGK